MLISPELMQVFLSLCLTGMALLAAFYLRRREMSWWLYLAWGLFALLVPLLGPFLVIYHAPGKVRTSKSPTRCT